jgi:hypothetical protein
MSHLPPSPKKEDPKMPPKSNSGTIHTVTQDHPDAAYIKRDDIGLVIAKGLAVMYKT